MGLFALPLGKTDKENVEEAIANLKIYLENSMHPGDMRYLLTLAIQCIEEAKRKTENK